MCVCVLVPRKSQRTTTNRIILLVFLCVFNCLFLCCVGLPATRPLVPLGITKRTLNTHTCSSCVSSFGLCPGTSSFSISDITVRFPFTSANSCRSFASWKGDKGQISRRQPLFCCTQTTNKYTAAVQQHKCEIIFQLIKQLIQSPLRTNTQRINKQTQSTVAPSLLLDQKLPQLIPLTFNEYHLSSNLRCAECFAFHAFLVFLSCRRAALSVRQETRLSEQTWRTRPSRCFRLVVGKFNFENTKYRYVIQV